MKKKLIINTILFVFVLTLFLHSSSYAIYRGLLNIGGTLASSEWSVSLNQENVDDHLEITRGGDEDTYTLTIVSNSEVDIVYSIVISNVPSGVSVSLDEEDDYYEQSNNQIIIPDAGSIIYTGSGNNIKTHTLTFKASSDATVISNQELNVDIIVRQYM